MVDIKIEEQFSPLDQIKSLNQAENILAWCMQIYPLKKHTFLVYHGGKIISSQQRFYIKGHCLQFCLFIEITKFVSMHPLNLKTKA